MSSRDTFAQLPPREQARVLGLIALLDALMGRGA